METKLDTLLGEALKRYESHDDLSAFLMEHPEIKDEVMDLIAIQDRLKKASATVVAPREVFMRVLKGMDDGPATSLKKLPEVSPYFSMPLFRMGVPALLLLIIVLGVAGTGERGAEVATLEEGGDATMNTMNMKASSPTGGATPEAAMMSMQAVVAPEPVPATGSVDDLILTLQEDTKAEIAAATIADENFTLATNDSAELEQFVNIYDENTI